MTIRSMYRSAAALIMLGAAFFVVGIMLVDPPPAVTPVPQLLVMTFSIFVLIGLPAIYLYQREGAGMLGFIGAALVFVSLFLLGASNFLFAFFVPGLAGAAPEVVAAFPDEPWEALLHVQIVARTGFAVGFVLFGIATYRTGVLPKWAAVMVALGGIGAVAQLVIVLLDLPMLVGKLAVMPLPLGLFGLAWGMWTGVAERAVPVDTPKAGVQSSL